MSSQLRLFDGHAVETFRGRLSAFDIDDEEANFYRADEMLILVVACSVEGASFKRTSDGGWQRTNNLPVHAVRVAKGEMRDELIDIFGLTVEQQLPLEPPAELEKTQLGGSTGVEPNHGSASSTTGWAGTNDPALASFLQGSA